MYCNKRIFYNNLINYGFETNIEMLIYYSSKSVANSHSLNDQETFVSSVRIGKSLLNSW